MSTLSLIVEPIDSNAVNNESDDLFEFEVEFDELDFGGGPPAFVQVELRSDVTIHPVLGGILEEVGVRLELLVVSVHFLVALFDHFLPVVVCPQHFV